MLDGLVGLVIGSFEFAVRLVLGIRLVMEATVGEWTAEALVEEQEEERDLHALSGEPVGIATAIALEQPVAFQLAQVIAELVQTVSLGRKIKGGENGFVDLLGSPAAHGRAPVQENLQQADDTDVLDTDAGKADREIGRASCRERV